MPTPEVPHSRPTVVRWWFVLLGGAMGLVVIERVITYRMSGRRFGNNARMTIAAMQARAIYTACRLYAQDHEGRFPTAESGATEAFRKLFPDIFQEEVAFYVPGSAWHDEAPDGKPDGNIGAKPDWAACLERGENHWAYVTGFTDSGDPGLPVIADGFAEGRPGYYTDDPRKKGGVWKGTKAVVVYGSGAAKAERLSPRTGFRVMKTIVDEQGRSRSVDLFSREGGLPEGARVLNPW
jgi:hypothetical protein